MARSLMGNNEETKKYNTNASIIRVTENLRSFVGLNIFISADCTYTKHRHGRISRIRTGSVNAYLVLLLCHVKMKVVIVKCYNIIQNRNSSNEDDNALLSLKTDASSNFHTKLLNRSKNKKKGRK